MSAETAKLHFVMFPFMAQGHMIPMMDTAKILLQRNVVVTVFTTPQNASRFASTFARFIESGYDFRFIQLQFPYQEAGLPEGCENLDMLPSLGTALSLFNAPNSLQQQVEKLFEELNPPPSCIISDICLPYTIHIANKFSIPRISFCSMSCFFLFCQYSLHTHNFFESISIDETEYFVLPGIPDKIEMTKAQLPSPWDDDWKQFDEKMYAAETASYGMILNSFEELEPTYARDFKKVKNDKIWCIGPVSLSNKDQLEKAQRGNKTSIDEWKHLKWLDSQKLGTVIYACLGSLCNLTPLQMIELGLALEASKRPFIWVIREGNQLEALQKWIKEDGFGERTNSRGLIVRGWAPQLLILSHPAIGGFLTHCGWNSTLEAISAGVPMITWPLFGDQFVNERLVVEILKVGVRVGVESPVIWGKEEEIRVLVKKKDVEKAIEKLMDETTERKERRKRIEELAEKAKASVNEGGSSHYNVTLLIEEIMQKNNGDDV